MLAEFASSPDTGLRNIEKETVEGSDLTALGREIARLKRTYFKLSNLKTIPKSV